MSRFGFASFLCVVLLPLGRSVWATPESEIAAATGEGRAVFLVVTESGARGTESAVEMARRAQDLVPRTALVLLDRAAPENRTLVERFRVLGAPVPLILVLAPNGVVAGGALLRDATPEVLARLVPTPRKADLLLHLSRKIPVFVVASRRTMVDERGAVYEACNAALATLEGKAATVVVDMDDKAEKAFLAELKVGDREPAPVTAVYNARGQKTAVFRGAVTADQLVEAARKRAPCCPGGGC